MIRWALCAALLLSDLVLVLSPPGDVRAAAAFGLLWVLPGLAWGRAMGGRWVSGLGLGIAVNAMLALLLHYVPGPIPFTLAAVLFSLSALLPVLMIRRPLPGSDSPVAIPLPLVLLFLLAVAFRLPHLGYSEFQGDEGVIMVRAAAAIEGDDAELFLHQKGPAEILLPMASWCLSGAIDEFWGRLPFAWASILGVMAVAQLCSSWFGGQAPTGWLAGVILALNGFHVAFGRIIQYQSLVVLMALLALLALDRYRINGRFGNLLLGTVFLAFAALSHYDAILFLPAAVALLFCRCSRSPFSFSRLKHLVLGGALGMGMLALFYLPFALSPSFGKTASYLAGDRVGSGLHANFGQAWEMSTVYNSGYYIIFLLLLLTVFLLYAIVLRLPDARISSSPQLLAAGLFFLVPFFFFLVVAFDPRTHLYTFYPGAALLAGAAANALWRRSGRSLWRFGLVVGGGGLFVLSAAYVWMVFVDHTPEYQRTFPLHKSALYWTTYSEMPLYGRFGFPHQAGWRAISALMAQGEIAGVYASNEEQEITDWYTRQAPRTHCSTPDVYIVAQNVQDEIAINWSELGREYSLAGTVMVDAEPRIRWYIRTAGEPVIVNAEGYRQWWRTSEIVPATSGGEHQVDYVLGDRIRLIGYDLDEADAEPGGRIRVTLYWRPLAPLTRNYQVFTHLYDGQMRGQDDGAPECAINPTTRWEPGQVIPDPHWIPIDPDVNPSPIPLLVGMYDLLTGDRLVTPGAADNAIHLTDVNIREKGG